MGIWMSRLLSSCSANLCQSPRFLHPFFFFEFFWILVRTFLWLSFHRSGIYGQFVMFGKMWDFCSSCANRLSNFWIAYFQGFCMSMGFWDNDCRSAHTWSIGFWIKSWVGDSDFPIYWKCWDGYFMIIEVNLGELV